MHLTIRWKLILSISIPLLVTYAGLLGWDYFRQRENAVEQMQALATERAQNAAAHLDARLAAVMQVAESDVTSLENRPNITDLQLRALMMSGFRQNSWVVATALVLDRPAGGESGGEVSPPPPPPPVALLARRMPVGLPRVTDLRDAADAARHPWLRQVREQHKAVWTTPYPDAALGRSVCTYAAPLMSGEQYRGAVAVSIAVEQLQPTRGRPDRPDRPARLASLPEGSQESPPPPPRDLPERRESPATDPAPDLRPRIPAPEGTAILDGEGRPIVTGAPRSVTENASLGPPPTIFELAEKYDKQELADAARQALAGKSGVLRVSGLNAVIPGLETDRYHWIAFAPIPSAGWILTSAISESSVMDPILDRLLMRAAFLAAGMVILLAVVMLVSIRISRPIERLAGAVDRLAEGDLDARVGEVRGGDELARLARGFDHMTGQLKAHVAALTEQTAAREKVESELRIARQIQTDLLPRTFPPFPERKEFQLHAINVPAATVAGDFYDFFFTTPDKLTLVIADVSGHGVPAALLMAVTRTIIRNLAHAGLSPAAIVDRANAMLLADTSDTMFVTLFLAQYEPASGRITYVNAGHPPPLKIPAGGGEADKFGDVSSPLLAVGSTDEMGGFRQGEASLAAGESLVLYTDGVTEAKRDDDGQMLRDAGLRDLIRQHANDPPDALCRALTAEIDTFQSHRRSDDLTLMVLRRCS